MLHALDRTGFLTLTVWLPVAAAQTPKPVHTSLPPAEVLAGQDPASTVEGAGPWDKAFCILCLGALLSGGTSVAAVIITALVNPELTFACTGICIGAF